MTFVLWEIYPPVALILTLISYSLIQKPIHVLLLIKQKSPADFAPCRKLSLTVGSNIRLVTLHFILVE